MPQTRTLIILLLASIALSLFMPAVRKSLLASSATSPLKTAVETSLAKKVPQLDIQASSPRNAIDRLQETLQIPIRCDWRALEAQGWVGDQVTLRLYNIRKSKALQIVADSLSTPTMKLQWSVGEDGVIVLGPPPDPGAVACVNIYDLNGWLFSDRLLWDLHKFSLPITPPASDVLFAPKQDVREDLRKLEIETIAPETWVETGGKPGQADVIAGWMIVIQSPEAQHSTASLMEQLREQKPGIVKPENTWKLLAHPSAQFE